MQLTMIRITCISILVLVPLAFGANLCKNDLSVTVLTSSSQLAPNDKTRNHGPDRSPINSTETKDANGVVQMGAWVAEKNNFNQWIQLEMKDVSLIRGLTTQGRNGCCKEWVTKYRVLYSEDCQTKWTTVGDFNTTDKIFTGNPDQDTPVENTFHCPVLAKCIRINPLGWNKNIAMRVGLLGCDINLNPVTPSPSSSPVTSPSSSSVTSSSTVQSTTPLQSSTASPVTSSSTVQSTTSIQSSTFSPSTMTSKIASLLNQSTKQTMVSSPSTTQKAGPTLKTGLKTTCIKSCKGVQNGDYQSCNGCDMYVTCNWELMYDKRPCPAGTKWDDAVKQCEMTSTTCL